MLRKAATVSVNYMHNAGTLSVLSFFGGIFSVNKLLTLFILQNNKEKCIRKRTGTYLVSFCDNTLFYSVLITRYIYLP